MRSDIATMYSHLRKCTRSICDLFDFTSEYWVKDKKRNSNWLDEERNFYESLSNHDLDAAGVEESQFCDYR